MSTSSIPVLLRSFKATWGVPVSRIPDAELSTYKRHLREDIARYLGMKRVGTVYVITNGDPKSPLAEAVSDGETPTSRFVRDEFPHESRVHTRVCSNWGANVGSATALNDGLEAILNGETIPGHVLIASTTVDLSEEAVLKAVNASETYHLQVCGFLRQNHWERYQWRLVQNTAALWRTSVFQKHGLFSEHCNGNDGQTIDAGGKPALLAGMEDYHFMLRMFLADPDNFRWGMVMRRKPVYWSVVHYNCDEMIRHLSKILRQEAVIRRYAKEIFPDQSFDRLMDDFFSCGLELP